MKRMKRLAGLLLVVCSLLSLLPAVAAADTDVTGVQASVAFPVAGAKPTDVTVSDSQAVRVTQTKWDGTLNTDGTFKEGVSYTIRYTVEAAAGKLALVYGDKVTLNQNSVAIESCTDTQAVLNYSFAPTPAKAPVTTGDEGILKKAMYYITPPVAGAKPDMTVATDQTDAVYITNVKWGGTFDENGCFIAKNKYPVKFDVHVRDGVDLTIYKTGVVSMRNHWLGDKLISTGTVRDGGKTFTAYETYKVELPTEVVNMSWLYTMEYADTCWWENNPKLFVAKTRKDTSWLNKLEDKDEQDQITRVIVDCEDPNPLFITTALNITEVWLSPKVDAVKFLQDFIYTNPDVKYAAYAMESNGAQTWNFKLYVSDRSMPKGLLSLGGMIHPRVKWFETIVYSGDVYEAYEKEHNGQSVAKPWCPGHEYTEDLCTADRVMTEMNCQHTRWHYYSCKHCGKPENNPKHVFATTMENYPDHVNDLNRTLTHALGRSGEIKAANYLGRNEKGEYVYLKTCYWCGLDAKSAVTYADLTRAKFNALGFGEQETSYEDYRANAVKAWENAGKAAALKATVQRDAVHAFAVAAAPVTAKVSGWAESPVNWAKEEGLLDEELLGKDYTKDISRLQFCSIAVKLAEKLTGKEIAPASANTFSDTKNTYVLKAYAAGITAGTGNGTFSPNATLTREQMATFMSNVIKYVKHNSGRRYSAYDSRLGNYKDSNKISGWAKEPMALMNAYGLINGTSATTLSPIANCTIEQAVVVARGGLTADQVGWYQCIRDYENSTMGVQSGYRNKHYFSAPYDGIMTPATYQNGDRVWVTGAKQGGLLPTTHPYTGEVGWVPSEDFKPIEELLEGDGDLYDQYVPG